MIADIIDIKWTLRQWRFDHKDPGWYDITEGADQKVIEDEFDIKQKLLGEVWNRVKNALIEMTKGWNQQNDDCDLTNY